MSHTSYDNLRKSAHFKTLEKQEVHDATTLVKGVAKILEMIWTEHTPAYSANNFAKAYNSYISKSSDILEKPYHLDNFEAFNKDIGCALKLKGNGISDITLKAFQNTLKHNNHGIDDLIKSCQSSTSSPSDEMTYCSQKFFSDIQNHFLPLAGLCEAE